MNKTNSLWGSISGKLLAAFIVVAVIFGAVALSLTYAVYGDVLLDKDDIKVENSVNNGDNSVQVKLRLEKKGFNLADIKLEKDNDKIIVKFYASVEQSEKYKSDSTGLYKLNFKFNSKTKKIVQEDSNGEQHTLVTLNHKS